MQKQKEMKYISSTCLYNYSQLIVENEKNNILYTIDMRELEEYKAKHFKEAIHKTNEKKLQLIKHETTNKRKVIIVFYNSEETQKNMKRNLQETLENEKEKEKEKKINNVKQYDTLIEKYFINIKAQFFVLKDGFTAFEKEYPFLCLSEEQEKSEKKNETQPQLIASINYPLRILENIYLGNFIHINNIHIYRFLKIKHVYDFTGSGFSNKMQKHIHYHRYDVFNKQFENKNFSAKEPITYSNFLSVQFIHNIIHDIAKHDEAYQTGEKKWEGKGKTKKVEAEKETHEETEIETETERVTETERDVEKTIDEMAGGTEEMGTGREKGNYFKDVNTETNDKVHREDDQDRENRSIQCKQEYQKKYDFRIETENNCESQEDIGSINRIFPKQTIGADEKEEVTPEKKRLMREEQQRQETNSEKNYHIDTETEKKRKKEKEKEKEHVEMNREMEKKHIIKMDETGNYETKTDNGNEQENEKDRHTNNKQKRNLETKTEVEKSKNYKEQLEENKHEEVTQGQEKFDAILILCNDGIKNQTKTKINSISLIICMCYIMFRNRCNENIAIAQFLKIFNDLEINGHTFNILKSYYHYLQSHNFCLEQTKPKENEQKGAENNIEIQVPKEKKNSQKNDQNKRDEPVQRNKKTYKNETESEDSEDSENSSSSNSDGNGKRCQKNKEYQKHKEIGKNTTAYEHNKNNVIDESEDSGTTEDSEHTDDDKTHTKNKRKHRSKRNRSYNMEDTEHPLQSTFLEMRKNDMCKGILNSFKIKEHFVIFEENKSNIIYMKYDAPGNNTEKTKGDYSLKLMNKTAVIYNITNEVYYDYEHILASILYNVFNSTIVEKKDVETCVRVLYEAKNFEKHRIFVTMPYISLILFNLCVLKTKNELEPPGTQDIKKRVEKQNTLDKHIVYLLHSYTKDSILYILYNVQIPTGMSEIKITYQMTKERLQQIPLAEEHYLVLAALKYFLITLLYFYVNKYIETMNCTCLEKFNKKLLKHINTFADCYYAKFIVDIHKFLRPNYVPEVDPYDNLPYYFSDILRPYILLHNYFVE